MKTIPLLVAAMVCSASLLAQNSPAPKATPPPEKPHLRSVEWTPRPGATATPASAGKTKGSAMVAKDIAVLKEIYRHGLIEVELGRLAQQQAKSTHVRRLGGRIAAEHRRATQELNGLAEQKGLDLAKEKVKRPEFAESRNFDQQYLAFVAKEQGKVVAAASAAMEKFSDRDLQTFVEKIVPIWRAQLDLVKAAQEKLAQL
jgi:putative membrane protein